MEKCLPTSLIYPLTWSFHPLVLCLIRASVVLSAHFWSLLDRFSRRRRDDRQPGQRSSPRAKISLPVVTSKSYQVSLLDIDYQIVSAVVHFQTVILRHIPTSSSPLECCCQFYYQELSSPTTNSEITKKGEGSNIKKEVCVCLKITKIWLLYKFAIGQSKSHSLDLITTQKLRLPAKR